MAKINQNCKLLDCAEDAAVHSVMRRSRIGVSEVGKSIQYIQVYLKESGLEIEPNKFQFPLFSVKKRGIADGEWKIMAKENNASSVKSIKLLNLLLTSNLD
jgi:hypothetical protein